MTTTTLDTPATQSAPSRILAVTRLHFVNTLGVFGIPWLVMASIFIVNITIWALIFANVTNEADRAGVQEGLQYSGASGYIIVYMAIIGIQSMAVTFPFALGWGVTRRNYYLGASLAFVILSGIYAAAMTLLSGLEELTSGWGFGERIFTAIYFGEGAWWSRFFVFFAILLFFFFAGALFATIYVRWRVLGIVLTFVVLAFLAVGVIALILYTDSGAVIDSAWVAAGDFALVFAALIPTVIAGVVGYLVMRRATPRV
jgi:hypothetical protein